MLRVLGGAVLILAAVAIPSAADVPPEPSATVRLEDPCPPEPPAPGGQMAELRECADCIAPSPAVEAAAAAPERPVRISKSSYSPLGEAVLNLLRSQGGGHLRP